MRGYQWNDDLPVVLHRNKGASIFNENRGMTLSRSQLSPCALRLKTPPDNSPETEITTGVTPLGCFDKFKLG